MNNPPNPDELKAAIAECESYDSAFERIKNYNDARERICSLKTILFDNRKTLLTAAKYALECGERKKGLLLSDKTVQNAINVIEDNFPASESDGADEVIRAAMVLCKANDNLRNELAAERQKREEMEKQMGVPFAELLSRCTEAWPEVVRPTGPPTVCDLVEGLVATALRLTRTSESLRAQLADPPLDVQELVVKKLGLSDQQQRIHALEASNRVLRKALEWYAIVCDSPSSVEIDGSIAKRALAQTPDEAKEESCS